MPGIGVIANPNSRRNRRHPETIPRLGYVLGDRGTLATTKDVNDIYRVAEEFKARQVDILCLNGGDGTNHCTLSAFLQVYGDTPLPRLAFLRGGTMNTIAWDIGLKTGTPASLLLNIVEKYHNGLEFELVNRHMLKVGDSYGFIFGNGLISNFLGAYYEAGDPNPWTAVSTLTRSIASAMVQGPFIKRLFERVACEVVVDGERWPREAWDTVAAATVGHIGLGFQPFYEAVQQPGTLHALGMACGAVRTVRQLPNFFRARPPTDPDIFSTPAHRMELSSEKPFQYTVDGDLHSSQGHLVLEVGPKVEIIRS